MQSKKLTTLNKMTRLIKVRNPYGNEALQYSGKWSDSDTQTWDAHPDVKEVLDFRPTPDGTFWMTWERFVSIFDGVVIAPVNMAEFHPPPSVCNTNWGASQYHPGSLNSIELVSRANGNQCAWCAWRGLNESIRCENAW